MQRSSPYKGLDPFLEPDAAYFVGRDDETRLIIANLSSYRLTLLYGPTGVGKSSIVRAGVLHRIRRSSGFVAVVIANWLEAPFATIRAEINGALGCDEVLNAAPIETQIERWRQQARDAVGRRSIVVIFDQFEDYFLYRSRQASDDFAEWFPRLVQDSALPLSFVVSMREDALAHLDAFKSSLPDLFKNRLRLQPLTKDQARAAIVEPVRIYAEETGIPYEIEPALADTVVDQVDSKTLFFEGEGRGAVEGSDWVETPYLQLVMERVWSDDTTQQSRQLSLNTFQTLGGAKEIIELHLKEAVDALSEDDRRLAAALFTYLVTKSGTKISYSADELADYVKAEGFNEQEVKPLLERFTQGNSRILRSVVPRSSQAHETRYEIYHDVLAMAVLRWSRDVRKTLKSPLVSLQEENSRIATQARSAETRVRRLALTTLAVLALLAITATLLYRKNGSLYSQLESLYVEVRRPVVAATKYTGTLPQAPKHSLGAIAFSDADDRLWIAVRRENGCLWRTDVNRRGVVSKPDDPCDKSRSTAAAAQSRTLAAPKAPANTDELERQQGPALGTTQKRPSGPDLLKPISASVPIGVDEPGRMKVDANGSVMTLTFAPGTDKKALLLLNQECSDDQKNESRTLLATPWRAGSPMAAPVADKPCTTFANYGPSIQFGQRSWRWQDSVDVVRSRNGIRVAIVQTAGDVRVMSTSSAGDEWTIPAPTDSLVALDHSGEHLAVFREHRACVWVLAEPLSSSCLSIEGQTVSAIALSASRLAALHTDGQLDLWDLSYRR